MKCTVCSNITRKPKILGPKWNMLKKHGATKKARENMANGIKKGQWYVAQNCKHLHFEHIYASISVVTMAQQLAVVKEKCTRKHQQMATIVHLFQDQGWPMLEYMSLHPLFSFLGVLKLPKRHWSDVTKWDMAKCLLHQIEAKTKLVMQAAQFFFVTCHVVTTLDNQAWISIHAYVCENWTCSLLLLSLEQVVDESGSEIA